MPRFLVSAYSIFDEVVIALDCTTFRALPIVRDIFEACTGRNTRVRIAFGFVIHVGAVIAAKLSHGMFSQAVVAQCAFAAVKLPMCRVGIRANPCWIRRSRSRSSGSISFHTLAWLYDGVVGQR